MLLYFPNYINFETVKIKKGNIALLSSGVILS